MKYPVVLTAAVFGLSPLPTLAEPETEIEETRIIASRVPTPADALGVSVDMIDRDTIEALGYNHLGELLDLRPGVSVTRNGGAGKATVVRIRGEEGFRTRITLDGIDIADPSSPQVSPRIEHLLTDGLHRIEILRGPQGLLYGADGGGVIALSSQPELATTQATLNAEAGADGFTRIGASAAGSFDRFSGSIALTDVTTDGFNARPSDATAPDDDGYENTTVHANTTFTLNDQWQLAASAHRVDGDNEYDGCFDLATFSTTHDCRDDYSQLAWRGSIRRSTEQLVSELSYQHNEIERAFYSKAVESYATEGEQQKLSWLNRIDLGASQRLVAGIDWDKQALDDGSFERERKNTGVYAEYRRELGLGSASAAVRHDDNDDFGRYTSWRLSTIQHLPTDSVPLSLKAAIGTGFRAPSLYEIAYNRGPFAYAPASTTRLDAERSRGWELGLQVGSSTNHVAVTWFDQTIEDEIYFDLQAYSGYLQRQGESRSKGLEVTASSQLGQGFGLTANATWNETEDAAGQQRPYRPELTAAASLTWENHWLTSSLTARFAQDSIDTGGQAMEDYSLLDWSIIGRLSDALTLNLRLENITDNDNQQIRDFNIAGRRGYIGIRYSL